MKIMQRPPGPEIENPAPLAGGTRADFFGNLDAQEHSASKAALQASHIDIANIYIGHRHRTVDLARVKDLAASISEIGLLNPVTVATRIIYRDGREATVIALVAGLHRVKAYRALGLTSIPYHQIEADEIEAEMAEIAENLHRAELTVLERDLQLTRYLDLAEEKKLAQGAPVYGGRGNTGGINQAARDLGIERTDAQRAMKVASLTQEAQEVAKEIGLDNNRKALMRAARAEPARQVEVLKQHKSEVLRPKVWTDSRGRRMPERPTAECMERGIDQLENTIEVLVKIAAERPDFIGHPDALRWSKRLEKARTPISQLVKLIHGGRGA
jgi:predicted transcriptional regulator